MPIRTDRIALRVASALLLHQGELSVGDIASLPFVRSADETQAVVDLLLRNYDVEISTRKISSGAIPQWEQLIRLKT